ncbi:MAG: toprim domain-containing protein [Gammaproteobacteria bacterium]
MASIEELKDRIDLHDLADKLGLERPQGRGNYKSPHHADKSPSLAVVKKGGGRYWRDYSGPEDAHGSCVDLVMYVEGCDLPTAVRRLHELYGYPMERPGEPAERRERSLVEHIADKCKPEAVRAVDYLVDERKIPAEVARAAVERGAVGFNTWTNPKAAPGEQGYGGDAVAFIVKTLNPGRVVAVDMRYVDPTLNGGVKTQSQGEKRGHPWFADLQRLKAARTVYVVESAINALSVEACGMPYTAAIATRALYAFEDIAWKWFAGKQLVFCFDYDQPDRNGRCAGQEASWRLYDQVTAENIGAMLVDQSEWEENDVNDVLKAGGVDELRMRLNRLQPWALQGLPGKTDHMRGRSRLYLPSHDYAQYWRYRVKPDFTSYVSKVEQDDAGEEKLKHDDLCGFRVAAISRVRLASAASVLSGEEDHAPRDMFAVTVQVPRHGANLQRRVFADEQLHNVDVWGKFGPVYSPANFKRLVNVLERGADLGARDAINFVGLGWLNGRPVVNEGGDCYFVDPDQQCPYSSLRFPAGPATDAAPVLRAYAQTFRSSAALLPLIWALGGHMKCFLGYWPHLVMQAAKGMGKSTLCKRLEGTLGMTVFAHESMGTQFRILTTVSHTSHAVGWEEISAGKQDLIDQAVRTLQQSYQHAVTRRGSAMTEFVLSAPVLLAGEDVPVKSLQGKVVRTDLTDRQGPKLPKALPAFPVRAWLEFLARVRKDALQERVEGTTARLRARSRARAEDSGAQRMIENYGAVLAAWELVLEFAELAPDGFTFEHDLVEEMNRHIADTDADREPWVWIVEVILAEIDSGRYRLPAAWDDWLGQKALFIRHTDMINHLRTNSHLRDIWNSIPIKSPKVLRQALHRAGAILSDDGDKRIGPRRVNHMLVLSVDALESYGLNCAPTDPNHDPFRPELI